MANEIMVIHPWKEGDTWMFTDTSRDLRREPFVGETNDIIDAILTLAGIDDAMFELTFSAVKFPGAQVALEHVQTDDIVGDWYQIAEHFAGARNVEVPSGVAGWLCPALLKYFDEAPAKIYVKFAKIDDLEIKGRILGDRMLDRRIEKLEALLQSVRTMRHYQKRTGHLKSAAAKRAQRDIENRVDEAIRTLISPVLHW